MSKIQSKLCVIPDLDSLEFMSTQLQSHRFPVHFHDTFVIQLIGKGTDWCCVNDLRAEQGEVFVHFPFATHSGGTELQKALQYQAIYPSIKLFTDLTRLAPAAIPSGSFISRSPGFVEQVRNLFLYMESKYPVDRLLVALRQVFITLLREHQSIAGSVKANDRNQKLDAARNYLVEHVNNDVTIEELSDRCGLSPFHLVRSFKTRFGITPRRFLISQRVSLAKQLMTSGTPVANAALSAGFSDQSHLNRCFKRVTALSPGQFRNATVNQ